MRFRNLSLTIAIIGILASDAAHSQTANYRWPPDATRETIRIWPAAAPDPIPTTGPEADTTNPKNNDLVAGKPLIRLGNVSEPTLTLYKPTAKNSGAAVVVFPGGGYQILAIDLEGTEVCQWLNKAGITCALLKYRVPNTGPYPKPAAALQDAQRAVSIVRANAVKWQIDPKRIGVLGFSAGGHLAAAISNHCSNQPDQRLYQPIDATDKISCRPDFAVVVYPGYLADAEQSYLDKLDIHPTAQTPPSFIVQAEDDPVHVENSTAYFLALKNAKVPAELHIYSEGGHGYGLRPQAKWPITTWPQSVETWLHTIHILGPTQP